MARIIFTVSHELVKLRPELLDQIHSVDLELPISVTVLGHVCKIEGLTIGNPPIAVIGFMHDGLATLFPANSWKSYSTETRRDKFKFWKRHLAMRIYIFFMVGAFISLLLIIYLLDIKVE